MNTETNQMLRTIELEARIKTLEQELGLERIHSNHLDTLNKSCDKALIEAHERIPFLEFKIKELEEENKRLEGKIKEAFEAGMDNNFLEETKRAWWSEFCKENNIKP